MCAAVEHLLGRHDEASARLEATLRALPDDAGPASVTLMMQPRRATRSSAWTTPRCARGRVALSRGRASSENRGLIASALGMLALACAFDGSIDEARAARAEAAALVDAMADDELARYLDLAINALAGAEMLLDLPDEASAHVERGLAVAEATGQGQVLPILFWVGTVRTMRGRLRESAEVFDTAIEAARLAGHEHWPRVEPVRPLADRERDGRRADRAGHGAREHRAAARARSARSRAPAPATRWRPRCSPTATPPARVEALLDACGGEELRRSPGAWRASALELLTRCRLALGRREDAARAAAEAQACAAQLGLSSACGMADRATAAVALAAGEADEAARLALRSAAAFTEAGAPVQAALSRVVAGQALGAAGDTDRAAAELDRAAAEFEVYGAVGQRDAAERELRRLGRRSRYRRTRAVGDGSPLESLTERELQVARLVVDRRTNAEIAAELFLSTKTVETHLRNLFHKLGVSSRVEVARAIERADRESWHAGAR